ncbi:helix-turn-helix domain-containing protein [Streptomyces abyssomicinicus]|uniref:helix-turn-helix domain-containing protein n=1 Tax=Streptomyces abyssomicinicus TaxID=574929 RepID=UPI0012504C4D|nr:XRE family transcriptional regulator [Streptomyces abyssomicinicus]
MSTGNDVVARNTRLLREQRGLSMAELARQAGLAKQTLSTVEQGTGNPTVDTLFAIATALEVPVTRLVSVREEVTMVQRGDEALWYERSGYAVRSLDHVYGSGVIENFLLRIGPAGPPDEQGGEAGQSAPHPAGTLEHLYVISGRVRVGPVDSPVELGAGDFVRYPADIPHRYESLDGGEGLAHVVVSVPRALPGTGAGGSR